MQRFAPYLDGLAGQSGTMAELVTDWVRIPSGSYDTDGLARFASLITPAFAALGGTAEAISLAPQSSIDANGNSVALPLGKALRFRKRSDAPLRIFLGIHTDVVYGAHAAGGHGSRAGETPVLRREGGVLHASGAADAKGGIVILLKALEAFEASPFAANVGWEVLLNPDEELGSPGSLPLLIEAAHRNHLGLLFEPALPGGKLVGPRKGSGNFTAVIRGRAAHAGRDHALGRNAISALAEFIVALDQYGRSNAGVTVNVGKVEGGGPVNRVPDLAIARFNLRVETMDDQIAATAYLRAAAEAFGKREGFAVELHGGFFSPPKPLAGKGLELMRAISDCGRELGLNLEWAPSGGVSDGNKLAAAGLPNVDTLGAVGGNIHSTEEFLLLDSLAERARLTALLLMQLGSGERKWDIDVAGTPGEGV